MVLATNVAETSLTVPGITGVIDTGLARVSRWSSRTKVQRLPIEPVSQASAQQRAGRCGRVEAGIAIRLYSEEDFSGRPEFTEPEILRTSLASVILQMTSLGLGQVERFPFVDPPDGRAVRAGVQLLEELGALVPQSSAPGRGGHAPRLTGIGRKLARLPIDPRLARMILEADRLGCLREVLVITAALSIQDPRERPVEQRARADQLHARFRDPRSDFMGWLNLWRHLREQQSQMGSSAFRRMCREEHLNYLRVREWQDFESQLRQVAKQVGLRTGQPAGAPDGDGIHQALLSGLLSHIGLRDRDRRDYLGARGTRFAIFPGSGLFKSQPDLVMAAELVETSRLWGRQNAAIDPLWAERLGGDLVKRTYSEPHWSKKRASALAHERVTLYGVPLVADRTVPLGRHQPEVARSLFIRHALVQGEWHTRHRFFETNRRLLAEAEELEHRARRHDIVVDEETLVDFYEARVPAEVISGAHFDTWWKRQRRTDPELLTFDPAMLVRESGDGVDADFPQEWQEGAMALPLRYHFEPGHEADGVTIDVPLATLNTVGGAPFSWNVPGLRHDLVTALHPLTAQTAAGQLRARTGRRSQVPGRGPSRRGAAGSRARALPALAHRGARAPGRLGPDQGPRPPPPDLPGARRHRSGGGGRQGSRGAQAAAPAVLRPRHEPGRGRVRAELHGPALVDLRHDRPVVHPDPRRSRGQRLPGAGGRGRDGRPAGDGLGRRAGGPPPTGRTTTAAARRTVAGGGPARRPGQHRQAGAGLLAVPGCPRAAGRLCRRRGGWAWWIRRDRSAIRRRSRSCCGARRRSWRTPRPRCSTSCSGCWRSGGRSRSRCTAGSSWRCCPP